MALSLVHYSSLHGHCPDQISKTLLYVEHQYHSHPHTTTHDELL